MSLNSEQRAATIREFQENMSRLGLTAERRQGFWRQRQQSGANHHQASSKPSIVVASAAAEWSKSSPRKSAGAARSGVSGSRVEQIITLKSGVLEYPWIIRAYLLSRSETQGVELTPFMALRGNPHDYWFLDGDFIDRGEID